MAAAELESARARVKDFTSLVLGLFYLISTPLPLWNLFFEGGRGGGGWRGRCVGTFDLQNFS